MKYLLAATLLTTLFACQADSATAQSDTIVIGTVDRSQKLLQGASPAAGTPNLIFRMGEATAAPGQVACLPIEVSNFQDIIGFQYTMAYDSAALVFHSVRRFDLPGYGASNFGVRFADRGVVSTLWTDMATLEGVKKPEHHPIYEVCFTNQLPAGQSAEVKFQDGPTRMEIIQKGMQKLGMAYANGRITSR